MNCARYVCFLLVSLLCAAVVREDSVEPSIHML